MELTAALDRAIHAAGVPIVSVSIGDVNDKTTWKVQPPTLQAAAQPTIDAFSVTDPAIIAAELNAQEAASAGQKDLVATLAVVAAQTDVNWGTKTLAQKVATVQALMTTWKQMRTFVENNL